MYRKLPPSTTKKPKYGTLAKAPPPQTSGSAKLRPHGAVPHNHRAPLIVTVTWLQGSEPWFRVQCGEVDIKRPADTTLLALVLHLNGYETTT